jgi:glucan phosphoethanolaminetransferase (alkaline phosphatase superfamily)
MRTFSNPVLIYGSIFIGIYALFVLFAGWGLLNLDNKGTLEPAINSSEEMIALSIIILISLLLMLCAIALHSHNKAVKLSAIYLLLVGLVASSAYIVLPATGEALPYVLFIQSPLFVGIILAIYGYKKYSATITHNKSSNLTGANNAPSS